MATSFTGVPAIAQAKTPAARAASEKQETQYDLSNCDLRQRNYRSNFIEGNGPDEDTFVVVDRNTNREVDKSQYKFTFQKLSEEGYWEEAGESFPTEKGSYIIYAVAAKDGKYSGKTYGTSFNIVAKNDLALATMQNFCSNYAYTGKQIKPSITLIDAEGKTIDPSCYRLNYIDSNWTSLTEAPTEPGQYYVSAVAIEGKDYTGTSYSQYIKIVDATNISSFDFYSSGGAVAAGSLPMFSSGTQCINENGALINVQLEQNRDFEVSGYSTSSDGSNPTEAAPTEPGNYWAILSGIGNYSGTTKAQFTVKAANDLAFCNVYTNHNYELNEDIVKSITVKDSKGNIVDPSEYTLVFSQYGVDLAEVPTKVGSYGVRAVAKEGSSKVGETYITSLEIKDPLDLNCLSVANSIDGIPLGYTPHIKLASYTKTSEYYYQDDDFVIDHYESFASVDLGKEAPKESGNYYAVLKPSKNSRLHGEARVSVRYGDRLSLEDVQNTSQYYGNTFDPASNDGKFGLRLSTVAGEYLDSCSDYELTYYLNGKQVNSPTEPGTYTCTVKPKEGSGLKGQTASIQLTVADPYDISNYYNWRYAATGDQSTFNLNMNSINNDGESITHSLDPSTDFTITDIKDTHGKSLGTAMPCEPGNYTFTFEGQGRYHGTLVRELTIFNRNDLMMCDGSIDGFGLYQGRGGLIHPVGEAPKITLADFDGAPLKEGSDFKLEYAPYDEGTSGEELETNDSLWSNKLPAKGGAYYVRAKALTNSKYTGKLGFGMVSYLEHNDIRLATPSFNSSVSIQKDEWGYETYETYSAFFTGKNIDFGLNLYDGDKKLVANKDYTIKITGNKYPGQASITCKGIGSYTGEWLGTVCVVVDLSKSNIEIDDIPAETFDGNKKRPLPRISSNGFELVPGKNVAVAYDNNIEAGTGTVTFNGKGIYNGCIGSVSKDFRISGDSINSADVAIEEGSIYNGNEQRPGVTVSLNGTKLQEGTDYTVTYESNVNAGTAKAIVKGIGRYEGFVEKTFEIGKADISPATLDIDAQTYTGGPISPAPRVKMGSKNLILEEDYAITGYENNTEPGTAALTIEGRGNYEGTATGNFDITREVGTNRVSGETRFDTMASLCEKGGWNAGGTVILAYAANYPDALAAAALAGDKDSPILLTDGGNLTEQTKNQIERLSPTEVIVVGGPAAINDSVLRSAQSAAPKANVRRIWGQTRYETSLNIMGELSNSSDTVVIATGANFADALSISPYSYAAASPIVLCDPANGLSNEALAAIDNGGYSKAVIVGGINAVPEAVIPMLEKCGISNITRLSGETRYETSQKIAEFELSQGLGFGVDGIALATGGNFPDALAAGPVAGRRLSPLLLVDQGAVSASQWLSSRSDSISGALIVGGENAISGQDARSLASAMGIQ